MERKKKLKSVKYKGKTIKLFKVEYMLRGRRGGPPVWSVPTVFAYVGDSKIPIGTGSTKDVSLREAKRVIDAKYWG